MPYLGEEQSKRQTAVRRPAAVQLDLFYNTFTLPPRPAGHTITGYT